MQTWTEDLVRRLNMVAVPNPSSASSAECCELQFSGPSNTLAGGAQTRCVASDPAPLNAI